MDQLIPSLSILVEAFADCFRQEVFETFRSMVVAWIICPGPHTISEVWQATGLAARKHHDTAYSLFASAQWEWDELGKILLLMIVAKLLPTGHIFLVVDDTLSHKRGAKVAFGGFFLDAVVSTKRRKQFRFGLNWVVVGIAIHLPFRPDRYFCLPVLWKVYRKKGLPGHAKRTEIAARLARLVAGWLPDRECWLLGDSAYINASVLQNRPANLKVIGPLRGDAALFGLPPDDGQRKRGQPRKKGERLPTPKAMMDDPQTYPAEEREIVFLQRTRTLRIQTVRNVLWYTGAKREPLTIVLVRDPSGEWRDEVLLATDPAVDATFVIQNYCRRWGIEVAFRDSKQYLGLHDPQVRTEASVERAHPMAWFIQSVTILWYALSGKEGPHVHRDRPWYHGMMGPTFSDMLGALRLQLWEKRISAGLEDSDDPSNLVNMLIHWLAAVR